MTFLLSRSSHVLLHRPRVNVSAKRRNLIPLRLGRRHLLLQSNTLHGDRHIMGRMIAVCNLQVAILILARDRDFLAIHQTGLDDALEALGRRFEERLASDTADVDVDERDVSYGAAEDSRRFARFRAVLVAGTQRLSVLDK
jgi:hypothetical protein